MFLIILTLTHTVYAEGSDKPDTWQSQISPLGSSFTTLLNGQLEFILMEGWTLSQKSQYEYILTKEIEGS